MGWARYRSSLLLLTIIPFLLLLLPFSLSPELSDSNSSGNCTDYLGGCFTSPENVAPADSGNPSEFQSVDDYLSEGNSSANETSSGDSGSGEVAGTEPAAAENASLPNETNCVEIGGACFTQVDDIVSGENQTGNGTGEFQGVDEYLNGTPQGNETGGVFSNESLSDLFSGNETETQNETALNETLNETLPINETLPLNETLNETLPLNETNETLSGPQFQLISSDGFSINASITIVQNESEVPETSSSVQGAVSKDSFSTEEASSPAEEELTPLGVPAGTYDISILPLQPNLSEEDTHIPLPISSISLKGVQVDADTEPSLKVEGLAPSSTPFGKSSMQAFAIDPASFTFDGGELNLTAKGSELYKCAGWDFDSQTCNGEWIKIMDLVPGEEYTIPFNSTDPAYAEYSYLYGAPVCANYSSPCIANSSLLMSRGNLVTPEPNQPNTVDTCADGSTGTYMTDESVENITVTDLNGTTFNGGDTVNVTAWAYCYNSTADNINFVYSNSSSAPTWAVKSFVNPCPAAGFRQVSSVFRLDNLSGNHVVRVIIQRAGSTAATCGAGIRDDNDDVVFAVNGSFTFRAKDAIIAYRSNTGINALNSPKIRFWNSSLNGSWSPEIELPNASSPVRWAIAKWSPATNKIAVITLSDDGYLDAYICTANCELSTNWFYTSNIGSVAAATAQRKFDAEFETSTGNLIVVYAVNDTATNHDLAYKILPANASSFSGITEQYIDDSGQPGDITYTWVRLDRKPTASRELALIGFDTIDSDINAWIWNGTAWGNQVSVTDTATATGGYEALAVKYAANGSKAVVMGGDAVATRNIAYGYWNGTAWSAMTIYRLPAGGGNVQWLNIKADPATDDLQAVITTTTPSLFTAYWDGAAMAFSASLDAGGIDTATARCADFEWNSTGSTGRLVWDTDGAGTTLSQITCTPQCAGAATTFSTFAGTGAWLTMWRNPSFPSSQVRILSARLNNAFAIGSFLFNGTGFLNYGDTAITAGATVSTYESYSIAFNITDATSPAVVLDFPIANYVNNTANPVNLTLRCNATDNYDVNNISLFITNYQNTSFSLNQTASFSGPFASATFNLSLAPGAYTWNCQAFDLAGNSAWGSPNRSITVGYNVFNCSYLSQPNSNYSLAANLFGNKSDSICLTINAPNITLNCTGFNITGFGGSTSGVAIINSTGARIENCTVSNYSQAFLLQSANNSLLRNNTGFSSKYGFLITSSYNDTLVLNTAYNDSVDGISLNNSNNNTILNNTAYNDTRGFLLNGSANNSFANNTARANGQGMSILDSNTNTFTNEHYYNNTYDFRINTTANALTYNISGVIFDNPYGNYTNYTNLSINDVLESAAGGRSFQISYNVQPATLPTNRISFSAKFINITNLTNSVSIDYISWNWLDSELTGYNESKFELWQYNSSNWTMLNSTPNTSSNQLSQYNMNLSPAGTYGILQNNATNCLVINSSGNYIQNVNYAAAPNSVGGVAEVTLACVVIASSNVDFSCAGYNITNNGTLDAAGILINGSASLNYTNVTIRDCPAVSGYEKGVYIYQSSSDAIRNSTAFNNTDHGFYLYNSSNNTLANNTAFNNTLQGFFLYLSSNRNTLANNTAYGNGNRGFYLYVGSSYNSLTSNTAYGNGNRGFYLDSNCIYNNLTSNAAYNNSNHGFHLYFGSNFNILLNNTAYNNSIQGFRIESSTNNTLTNNTAYNNTQNGFQIDSGSNFTSLSGNSAYNNTQSGFLLNQSNSSTFANNTAYKNAQSGLYIIDSTPTQATSDRYYGNGYDFRISTPANALAYNLTGVIFENPNGGLQNHTNLTVQDTLEAGARDYQISWNAQPSALPAGLDSFRYKYINITNLTNSISIDYISWSWLDTEITGYNKSKLEIWKYNASGWALLNYTPDTGNNRISFYNLIPNTASTYGILSDQSAPNITFVYPTPGNATVRNFNWAYINITSDEALNSSTLEWNGTNQSMTSFNSTSWYLNKTGLADGTYTYKVYGNDSVNNQNATETRTVTIDTTAPAWSSPAINQTPVYWNQTVNFTTSWTDAGGLFGYLFSTNQSSSWANSSFVSFTGSDCRILRSVSPEKNQVRVPFSISFRIC